jgi:hypothetical protein
VSKAHLEKLAQVHHGALNDDEVSRFFQLILLTLLTLLTLLALRVFDCPSTLDFNYPFGRCYLMLHAGAIHGRVGHYADICNIIVT